ncbi:phage-related contractile tail sheath protein [Fulvimarina pelagi HTCC2506]|uniref:Phage-related contractile tail sheath protein n=1 Tax=Fulvimarina pelagi HTCC2506 TaxID=314231 RepID=Q0FZ10_9HYPH|nr:tail sheath protein [Fulvimarina pelagi]EAU40148.1 phage-related contractile tail sheath protein [Fulvimarina pelagi HTCC2506]
MAATTDNVGTRVFSNLRDTVAAIDTRDSTVIGLCLPLPNIAAEDEAAFPVDEPRVISTDDPETLAKLGPGMAYDTIRQYALEGIITDVLFVRAAHSEILNTQIGLIAGDPNAKTGAWALLEGKAEFDLEPGLVQAPGFMSQRIDAGANPVVAALSAISDRIIDCMVVGDTPDTSRDAAAEWADDWATFYNVIGMYPHGRYFLDGQTVTRPLSPSVAAAIVRRDKEVGNPYKAAWNRPLKGLTNLSQSVSYRDGDTSHDANYLVQRGVGTVIEGRVFWAPFTTATDPTTVGYRSIKRIRTRRAIEKAMLRPLRLYLSEDIGPHAVTQIFQAANEALEERQAVGAIIEGSQVIWDRSLNPNNLLRKGGMRVKLRFEETPDLTDLGIYTEPQPEAFDILSDNIRAALERLGNPNIQYVAA